MRELSEKFMKDLKKGCLFPILKEVQKDSTLLFQIREGYINIYYRGCSALKLSEKKNNGYKAEIDKKYLQSNEVKEIIKGDFNPDLWCRSLASIKHRIDAHLKEHPKKEREFQQKIYTRNNSDNISEYIFLDIEYADNSDKKGFRFDMLAIHKENKKLAIIELKYEKGAISRLATTESRSKEILTDPNTKKKAPLIWHYHDMYQAMNTVIKDIRGSVVTISHQLYDLGLTTDKIESLESDHIEFILLCAAYPQNYQDNSNVIPYILTKEIPILEKIIPRPQNLELKFMINQSTKPEDYIPSKVTLLDKEGFLSRFGKPPKKLEKK